MVATTHNHTSQMMSNPSAGTDGLLLSIALKSFAWLVLAGMCAILATALTARKQAILALVQDLVQRRKGRRRLRYGCGKEEACYRTVGGSGGQDDRMALQSD